MLKIKLSKKSLLALSFFSLMLAIFSMASCSAEDMHRDNYWTNEDYPKYGLLSITGVPDSSKQEWLETIERLVRAGREGQDFVPENSLKYAKEIADDMYSVQMEGMRIYLGEFQKVDIPYYQMDSIQKEIFEHLKHGSPTDTSFVELN